MDIWNIEGSNECCWKKNLLFTKGQQVMEHAYELLCGHVNGQIKSKKMGLGRTLIE